MNVSYDRSPGHPEAIPQPGPDQAAQTGRSPGLAAVRKHSLTRSSTPAATQSGQQETDQALASAPAPTPASGCQRPCIQSFPHELLSLIFDCLPLSTHSQCALVCHRWYASLPSIRPRIAQWLETLSPVRRLDFRQLAVGYSRRTGPLLARQKHPLFPLLQRQHQELVRLQKERQQPCLTPDSEQLLRRQERTALGCLSGLIGYSLHQPPLQTSQLSLKSVSCHPPVTEPVQMLSFSRCSRWLAVLCHRNQDTACLRLYGWQQDGWHEQTLVPAPVCPVTVVTFALRMLDTLFTIQDSDVFVWRKTAQAGHWCAEKLYSVPFPYQPYELMVSDEDDLVSLATRGDLYPGLHVQISNCLTGLQCWQHLPPQQYRNTPKSIAHQKGRGLLGLLFEETQNRPDRVLILGKGLKPTWNGLWGAQPYRMKSHMAFFSQIRFSPDGQHLLGLTNTRLCLWKLDTENQILREKLQRPCWRPYPRSPMAQTVIFRKDGKQLLVAHSPHRLQLWNLHDNGDWHAGASVETPSTFDSASSHQQHALCLFLEDRILAIGNADTLLVWHGRTNASWQLLMHRQNNRNDRPAPPELHSGVGAAIYTTANEEVADAGTRLWIHAPDLQGQLVRQAQMIIPGPLRGTSADGLSLVINDGNQVRLLQLTHPDDKDDKDDKDPHR
ncbi:MAG: F-box/WD40 repeat-containing protein [Kistimonas sp.]|nr:F-box/WD40 repeat-containing protein [Kistimonas sp.]